MLLDAVIDLLCDCVALSVCCWLALDICVALWLAVLDSDAVCVPLALGVGLFEGVSLGDLDALLDCVWLGVPLRVVLCEGVCDTD